MSLSRSVARPAAVALASIALAAVTLGAQIVPSNPGIPALEQYQYLSRSGGVTETTRQTVALRNAEGKSWYEVTSQSRESDVLYRVDARTLGGFYSDVTERSPSAVIRRTSEIVSNTVKAKPDELLLTDLNSFVTTLRGFPWGKVNHAKLVFAGSQSATGGFNLELNVLGRETVKAGGTSQECWKMQMGLSGILSGLVPKSTFWYAVNPPHLLVRFEGARGGPGSPVTVLELQSYEASN